MASYYVVFPSGPSESSDAAVGSVPVASTKVEAPVLNASVAQVEAGSVTAAIEAARVAYPGRASVHGVAVISTQWKES